jgi:hypothetical protein
MTIAGRSSLRRDASWTIDPKRMFSDHHASLYETFNLQPHLIRQSTLRVLSSQRQLVSTRRW